MKITTARLLQLTVRPLTFALPLMLFSCSTLVGNVKPVDEKSRDYWVVNLAAETPQTWIKLDSKAVAQAGDSVDAKNDAYSNEVSDIAYQSRKTAAIISLNSACRRGRDEVNLQAFAQELVLGIHGMKDRTEKSLVVSGQKALETTVEGSLADELTKIRTVVLQKGPCIYDLMYISRPDRFRVHEADFARFVSSLKVR